MEKMKMHSVNLTENNINKIAQLFPNCVTETVDEKGNLKKAINFDILKQMLSSDIAEGNESYEFSWVGKKASIVEANKPIRKTLRPCVEESVNWDTTENLYIEGDNLEVLKLLQESYLGKVKMIYIDPPYNTGNDFIYNDDFKMSGEEYSDQIGEFDDDGNRMFKNTDSNGRFHSDWCSMIYPRLMLARNLLSDDGVIFISIDDNEVDNLKKICDEIFGIGNFLGVLVQLKGNAQNDAINIQKNHEYILVYSKTKIYLNNKEISLLSSYSQTEKEVFIDEKGRYFYKGSGIVTGGDGGTLNKRKKLGYTIYYNPKTFDKIGVIDYDISLAEISNDENEVYKDRQDLISKGYIKIRPPKKNTLLGCWTWSIDKFNKEKDNILITQSGSVYQKIFVEKECVKKKNNKLYIELVGRTKNTRSILEFSTSVGTTTLNSLLGSKFFDNPKNNFMIQYLLNLIDDREFIVLDFFSGSATTAHVVIAQNFQDVYDGKLGKRKFIMVQLPEKTDEKSEAYKNGYKNICEIGKERIRRAGQQEYMGVCGVTGSSLKWDTTKRGVDKDYPCPESVDIGFRVLKLDDTNMNDVYYSPLEINQEMLIDQVENIKSDRTDLDLLFGCLIDWGVELSMPYSSEIIEGCTVHNYNDGDLIACFDKNIPESVIKNIAKRQPLRAVFRDSCFKDSPSKINVEEIFKMIAPDTRVKVI